MEQLEPVALAAQLAMGLTLAALAGLRAFLPPLALGVAARAGLLTLSPEFEWLAATPTLIVLSAAVIFELLGDKFPVVDHLLDAAGLIVRPAAGALVASVPLFSVVHALGEGDAGRTAAWAAAVSGIVIGGAAGGAVHVAKSHIRLGATPLTAGLANPFLSLAEDAASLVGVVLSIIVPLLALLMILLVVALLIGVSRRRRGAAPQHG